MYLDTTINGTKYEGWFSITAILNGMPAPFGGRFNSVYLYNGITNKQTDYYRFGQLQFTSFTRKEFWNGAENVTNEDLLMYVLDEIYNLHRMEKELQETQNSWTIEQNTECLKHWSDFVGVPELTDYLHDTFKAYLEKKDYLEKYADLARNL